MKFKWRLFGKHLRDVREGTGMGLREIAHQEGIGKSTWSRAENGRPITVPAFLFLCAWMDKNPFQYR